ncbi:MAG TPA: hypothetical protein VK672_08330 [Solirubrobacteraceae bacterium]|nr:hypothetical protein [Solirubrobacteraceae bacterium]
MSGSRDDAIGVVHLVWAPLGVEPLREFPRSYHAHPAGAEHELVIVLNGAGPEGPADGACRESLLAELQGTAHRLIELERPVLDLTAYGQAARLIEHRRVCFLNSYSVLLADGWLGLLASALDEPGVGIVGATANWESQAEWTRGGLRNWPIQILGLRQARRGYPRFPNPHIRTTAFIAERLSLLEMGFERAADKRDTYLLESGWRSVTRQVQEHDLRVVVVGRDGRAYEVDEWPDSATFRCGGQRNLLVSDNQTRAWEGCSPGAQRHLSRDSWGNRHR